MKLIVLSVAIFAFAKLPQVQGEPETVPPLEPTKLSRIVQNIGKAVQELDFLADFLLYANEALEQLPEGVEYLPQLGELLLTVATAKDTADALLDSIDQLTTEQLDTVVGENGNELTKKIIATLESFYKPIRLIPENKDQLDKALKIISVNERKVAVTDALNKYATDLSVIGEDAFDLDALYTELIEVLFPKKTSS